MHLNTNLARPLTGLASSPLDIKAESAGLVAPSPRFSRPGKEGPNGIKHFGIGSRIGSRSTPDGTLVNRNNFVEMLCSLDRRMTPGTVEAPINFPRDCLMEYLVNQCGLSGPGNPGHADETSQREGNIDVFEVVFLGTVNNEVMTKAPVSCGRDWNRLQTGKVPARQALGRLKDGFDGSFRNQPSPMAPGSGTQIDNPVGLANGLLVMFDHNHGIPKVSHPEKCVQEALVVSLVQTN